MAIKQNKNDNSDDEITLYLYNYIWRNLTVGRFV